MNDLTETMKALGTIPVDDSAAMVEMWGITPAIIQEITKSTKIKASKHGMFASVPIICKGLDCAYATVCTVPVQQRTVGMRCPMEIGAILARFNQWCAHFGIDISGETIPDESLTDATLVRDLVNIEVQMIRCENKIAINGDFLGKTLADIDRKCKPYFETTVTPESQYLMTLQNNKIKILNQLNATRKDKASDKNTKDTPTGSAIRLFQQMQEAMKKKDIIDVDDMDFDEDVPDNTIVNVLDGPSEKEPEEEINKEEVAY